MQNRFHRRSATGTSRRRRRFRSQSGRCCRINSQVIYETFATVFGKANDRLPLVPDHSFNLPQLKDKGLGYGPTLEDIPFISEARYLPPSRVCLSDGMGTVAADH